MIGGRDHDRIDVVAVDDFAEIVVGLATFVGADSLRLRVKLFDGIFGRFAAVEMLVVLVAIAATIHIADSQNLTLVVLEEPLHDGKSLIANANEAQRDAIARGALAPNTEAGAK